jgi:hypothetical protein
MFHKKSGCVNCCGMSCYEKTAQLRGTMLGCSIVWELVLVMPLRLLNMCCGGDFKNGVTDYRFSSRDTTFDGYQ